MRAFSASTLFAAVAQFGLAFAGAAETAAPDRLAVVIGNQDYDQIADLSNARSDAEEMSTLLKDMGYKVFAAYDADRKGFEEVMRQAIINAADNSEIVFFYAGHGIQIGRRNYLLPTDVAFESIYDLPVESVTLDRVIEQLAAKGTVHVAIIDACRDNPFPDKVLAGNLDASLFETKSGFDVFQTPLNSLVAFSTAPGMVAYDGQSGGNSPYTSAIIQALETEPESDASRLFTRVREDVYNATDGKQVPWESSTLVQPFFFRDAALATRASIVNLAESGLPSESETTRDVAFESIPEAIKLNVAYDREIQLAEDLAQALGVGKEIEFSVTAPPRSGVLSLSENGDIVYRPSLREQRALTEQQELSDGFDVTLNFGDFSKEVAVELQLAVNACDMAAGDALDPDGVGYYRLPNEIDIEGALRSCSAAVQSHPDVLRFSYQLGRAQQAAGDYEAAFANFQRTAEEGYVRALNATARLLTSKQVDRDIFDVPSDRARATDLLKQGIDAGDPFAMHSLGQYWLQNGETSDERQQGFELLDRAAELGHTYSMNELGVYFLTKDSDHFNPERGMRYLQASADRNDIYGYHNLGFVALYGLRDGNKDFDAAFQYFKTAADGGHPHSPATLGRMIVRGQAPGYSADDAVQWYDVGLSRGDGWSGVNAAELVLDGEAQGTREEALIRAAKSLHLPNADAAQAAEKILKQQSDRDMGRAIQLFLNDLGQSVSVDGAIGPQTLNAIGAVVSSNGVAQPPNNRFAQLSALAKVYFVNHPIRSDVF